MKLLYDHRLWDVRLVDDGTLDTVISVQPVAIRRMLAGQKPEYWPEQETRFDAEYVSQFRRSDGSLTLKGLKFLGLEAIETYDFPEDENEVNQ